MYKYLMLIALIVISNFAMATDALWYWDNDGATKGLIPDPNCQCYFSIEFPVKVMPKSGAHFTLYDMNSQIITIKLSDFMKIFNDNSGPNIILSEHLDYELNYLKNVVGKDNLSIERKVWDKDNRILSWVVKRQSDDKSSYLVTNSMVKSGCVFYLSSIALNKSAILKIEEAQKKSLVTLKSHVPTSEEEAKKLISEFTKS